MDVTIDVWQLILFAGLTMFPPLLLMVVPYMSKAWEEKLLHPMLGISAGLLFGLVFLDIIPEGIKLANDLEVDVIYLSISILAGFFILTMVEKFMLDKGVTHGHHADGVDIKPFGTLGVTALAVHGFMDGFVIPVSLSVNAELGILVAIAIIIHQIPDSFAAMSMALAAGYGKKRAARYVLVTALDTPLGILAGAIILAMAGSAGFAGILVLMSLGFSAGTFVFVSAADLIPELQHSSKSMSVMLFILVGFALIFVLTQFLPF